LGVADDRVDENPSATFAAGAGVRAVGKAHGGDAKEGIIPGLSRVEETDKALVRFFVSGVLIADFFHDELVRGGGFDAIVSPSEGK
jgi:hypothetical protein